MLANADFAQLHILTEVNEKLDRSFSCDYRLRLAEKKIGTLDIISGNSCFTLWNFWIHKDFRRHGLGTQLMLLVLQDVKKLGASCVDLAVYKSNLEAISFYNRMGFQVVDDEWLTMRMERDLEKLPQPIVHFPIQPARGH